MALTQYFRWDDPGIAGMTNAAGELVAILDKILVDGYNLKTVTLTRSGSTVTASCAAHGFLGRHVLAISGASEPEYNVGLTRISVLDADTFTYEIAGTPATPATGTITAKIAPLGWSIAHTATNERSYERPAGSKGFFMNVTDTAVALAYFRLFETVTAAGVAVSNGSNPTPSATQLSPGFNVYKSNTGTPTRTWVATGTASSFNFMLAPTVASFDMATNAVQGMFVWDDPSPGSSAYAVHVVGGLGGSSSTIWAYDARAVAGLTTGITTGYGASVLRSPNLGAASNCGLYAMGAGGTKAIGQEIVYDYVTYGLRAAPVYAYVRDGSAEAQLPGIYAALNGPTIMSPLDVFRSAAGSDVPSRDFIVLGGTTGMSLYFDLSDDWVLHG